MHDVRFCLKLLTESKKCRDNGTLILIMRFTFRERRERERERERERGRRRGDDEKNG